MRSLILATFSVGSIVLAAPASAQSYDPSYPICKRVNSDAGSIDCYYTSMAQCREAIHGMSAECVSNPYYKSAQEPAAAARAQHHN
jgi:Tfp pilus assembly protein PilV